MREECYFYRDDHGAMKPTLAAWIVTMDDIEEAVAQRFHVKISEMKSRRRSKTLVHPRQIAMYLCRELTNSSFPEIGRQAAYTDRQMSPKVPHATHHGDD